MKKKELTCIILFLIIMIFNLFIFNCISVRAVSDDTINIIAGTVIGGYSGDGEDATSAQLSGPCGVTIDSNGNLYIADTNNNRIRKVNGSDGKISTIAGPGTPNNFDDWGPATSGYLYGPNGVAVDSSGNVYIADTGNNRIRKVNASDGKISTIAGTGTAGYSGDGGDATWANLNGPSGVAVDSSGNVYIADTGNNGIRKVNAIDGKISTFAMLNNPIGVAVDSSGNVYIADNVRIRKVNASDRKISTIAGTGTTGYSGDGGDAVSAQLCSPRGVAVDSSGNVYIADMNNNRIRKVNGSDGKISTIAGNGMYGCIGDGGDSTNAQLSRPIGVAVSSIGNVYIADTGNGRIRKVNAIDGKISTIAGTGKAGYSGDGGEANCASIYWPKGLTVDSIGNVYIADTGNSRIRKVNAIDRKISTIAGTGTAGYSGDGGDAVSAQLCDPSGVAVDSSGNVYIADMNNNRIRKVNANDGKISTIAGTGTAGYSGDNGDAASAMLNKPTGVAVDNIGDVYIADTDNNRIRKINASDRKISTIAGNGMHGYICIGDGGIATSAQLWGPRGVTVDSIGNVYIADIGNSRIRKVNAIDGKISTIAGTGTTGYSGDGGDAISAQLYSPNGIAIDSSGNVYIADTGNSRIRKVNASNGMINTIAGTGTNCYLDDCSQFATDAQLFGPNGVAVDNSGHVYVEDTFNNRILKMLSTVQVASVDSMPDIFVTNGTELADINLPKNVSVRLSNNILTSAIITWDKGNPTYDGNTAGTYIFSGALTLTQGVPNPNNYKASVKVVVLPPTYKVTYDGNKSISGKVPIDNYIYYQNEIVTVLGNTGNLTKTGYTFSGWNTAADGSGTNYQPNITFIMGNSNVVLYAQWTANSIIPTAISLDKTTDTIVVGATDTLIATVSPINATNKAVIWTSSDNSVATVNNNGVVTALSAGTVTITVTTADGSKTATCTVTVNNPNVTSVSLNKKTDTLAVGNTDSLTATVLPSNATNKAVTWTSSDNSVATVNNNGVVTAVSIGTATITVTTIDGNKTATCVVTVNPVASPENDFTFDVIYGNCTITGYKGEGGDVIIPSTIYGLNVTSIGNAAFSYCSGLTSVTIPDSVTSIGDYAFDGCSSLASAYFEGNAPTMGSAVFDSTKLGFIICYNAGETGFTNPWNGYKTAIYETNYEVTYSGNGSTGGAVPVDSNLYTQGATATVIGNTGNLVKTGYIFAGWNTAADGSGTNYTANATFTIGEVNKVLYANWIAGIYGDVDGDGRLSVIDGYMIKQFILGKITKFSSSNGILASDIDGDGKITSADYALIKRILKGK